MAGDVDVNSGMFAVTASDGSLAIATNMFTVASGAGDTVVAGTLDVAGDVDVNSGMFAVTASDRSLAIQTNKFTVAGGTGNTVVAGTLNDDEERRRAVESTLDVAGDVDGRVGQSLQVTASDGSLAIRQTSSRWPAARATRWWRGR